MRHSVPPRKGIRRRLAKSKQVVHSVSEKLRHPSEIITFSLNLKLFVKEFSEERCKDLRTTHSLSY